MITELVVLQRVFREAKFCDEPNDLEVSGSPIVARLYTRLIEATISVEVEQEGEQARRSMIKWLTTGESRAEWRAALKRARREKQWVNWPEEERHSYVRTLLAPFIVSPDLVERFILLVNNPGETETQ